MPGIRCRVSVGRRQGVSSSHSDTCCTCIRPRATIPKQIERVAETPSNPCFRLPCACVSAYQKKWSAETFRSYVSQKTKFLQSSLERLAAAVSVYSARSDAEREARRGEDDLVDETRRLLSVVVSCHLVLCRVAVLYPWRAPFNAGSPTFLHQEIRRVAGGLHDAWARLGVSGETRRQIVQRLIVVVGRQTLDTRQQINQDHYQRVQARASAVRELRGDAALGETEGENERNSSGK